jgi:hypothetical protein
VEVDVRIIDQTINAIENARDIIRKGNVSSGINMQKFLNPDISDFDYRRVIAGLRTRGMKEDDIAKYLNELNSARMKVIRYDFTGEMRKSFTDAVSGLKTRRKDLVAGLERRIQHRAELMIRRASNVEKAKPSKIWAALKFILWNPISKWIYRLSLIGAGILGAAEQISPGSARYLFELGKKMLSGAPERMVVGARELGEGFYDANKTNGDLIGAAMESETPEEFVTRLLDVKARLLFDDVEGVNGIINLLIQRSEFSEEKKAKIRSAVMGAEFNMDEIKKSFLGGNK